MNNVMFKKSIRLFFVINFYNLFFVFLHSPHLFDLYLIANSHLISAGTDNASYELEVILLEGQKRRQWRFREWDIRLVLLVRR